MGGVGFAFPSRAATRPTASAAPRPAAPLSAPRRGVSDRGSSPLLTGRHVTAAPQTASTTTVRAALSWTHCRHGRSQVQNNTFTNQNTVPQQGSSTGSA